MAAVEQKVSEILFRYATDPASIQRVENSNDLVRASITSLKNELGDLGPAAAAGVRRVEDSFNSLESELEQQRRLVVELRDELTRLDNTTATPTVQVQQQGGGGLDMLDRTGAVSSQILSGLGAGDAANVAGLAGDLVGAVTSLNPAMLLVTGAGVGLTAVLGEVARGFEADREAATNFLTAQGRIDELIAGGATRSDIQAVIDQQTRLLDARRAERDELQSFVDANENLNLAFEEGKITREELWRAYAEQDEQLSTATGGLITNFNQLQEVLSQYDTQINDLSQDILLNKNALDSTGVAANTAAQNQEQLQGVFVGMGQAGAELVSVFQNAAQAAYEEVQAQKISDSAKLEHIRLLEQEAEAQRAANLTIQYDAAFDNLTRLGKAQQDVNQAQNAYTAALTQSNARVEEANATLTQTLTRAQTSRLDALTAAEAKAGEDRLKALSDFEEAKKRIEAKYSIDRILALADRDSEAKFRADLAKEEQLQSQEQTLAKQEQTIDTSLRRQQESIQSSYDQQVQAAQDTASRALELEQSKGQAELAIRQQTLDAALVQLQNFENGAIAIMEQITASTSNMRYGSNYGTPTMVTLPNGQTQPGYAVPTQGINPSIPNQPNGFQNILNLNFQGETLGTMVGIGINGAQQVLGRWMGRLGYTDS